MTARGAGAIRSPIVVFHPLENRIGINPILGGVWFGGQCCQTEVARARFESIFNVRVRGIIYFSEIGVLGPDFLFSVSE